MTTVVKSGAKEAQDFKVPPKYKFSEGEKVLCFHGPLIYEAKCLQSRYSEKEKINQYHIHYSGWNKSWDEWVPETRVLKYIEANLQRQKELHRAQKAEPNSGYKKGKKTKKRSFTGKEFDPLKEKEASDSRSSTPTVEKLSARSSTSNNSSSQESASDVPKRKRSKLDQSVETEEYFLSKVEIKVKLPDELKPLLVDDWNYINNENRLLKIPASMTASTIIDEFKNQKVFSKNQKEEARCEVAEGIREYLNAMLGPQLLYKVEREQYHEIIQKHSGIPPSELYGAVHLLRLFVRLGGALAYTRIDEKTVQILTSHLNDFLKDELRRDEVGRWSPRIWFPPIPCLSLSSREGQDRFLLKNAASYFNKNDYSTSEEF